MYKAIIAILILVLSSCSSTPKGALFVKPQVPSNGKSLVYFYRPYAYHSSAIKIPVLIDGLKTFDLGVNGYYPLYISPGTYTFTTDTFSLDRPYILSIKAGETKYVSLNVKVYDPIGYVAKFFFEEKSFSNAKEEVCKTHEEI